MRYIKSYEVVLEENKSIDIDEYTDKVNSENQSVVRDLYAIMYEIPNLSKDDKINKIRSLLDFHDLKMKKINDLTVSYDVN